MKAIKIGKIIPQTHGDFVVEGHLGGFLKNGDNATYYPLMWSFLISNFNIKSVLDIGCGKGYSSSYFKSLNCKVIGIDGSIQAKRDNLIPEDFILHDYNNGECFNSKKEIDLCWSSEFVEHVDEKFTDNFLKDFSCCKYIAMTFAGPGQGGYHHVNCQPKEYWINKIEPKGYKFLESETDLLKKWAEADRDIQAHIPNRYLGLHFIERGLFFKKI